MNQEPDFIRFVSETLPTFSGGQCADFELGTPILALGIDSLALFSFLSYSDEVFRLNFTEEELLDFAEAERVADIVAVLAVAWRRGHKISNQSRPDL